jgi:hypothetical protein
LYIKLTNDRDDAEFEVDFHQTWEFEAGTKEYLVAAASAYMVAGLETAVFCPGRRVESMLDEE